MSRVPRWAPDELDADQRALYDAIAGGPRASGPQHFALTDERGALNGPFNALLLSPEVGGALQQVGSAVRFATGLSPRVREAAVLLVATAEGSIFERHAHEAVGRAAGLTEDELKAIRGGELPASLAAEELPPLRIVQALLAGDLDDDGWASDGTAVGARTVFELTTLVGYYRMLALQLRAFRADEV